MTPSPASSPYTSPERLQALAAHLRAGGLVILPTETVYGLAASGASGSAIAHLRSLVVRPPTGSPSSPTSHPAHTWHTTDVARAMQALSVRSPLQRRLFQTLAPGPVRFVARRPLAEARAMAAELGFLPGVIETVEGDIAVRIPDALEASSVIASAGVPIVIERVSAALLGGVPLADARHPSPSDVARATSAGIETLDLGPSRLGQPSTTIRLLDSGGYSIESEGAIDQATIRKRVERVILMVCTGNTCRSPMARAIAQHAVTPKDVVGSGLVPVPTRVVSAGVAAGEGGPMTPEARDALEEMGIDAGPHRSKGLTRAMLREADVVFAMTRGHLEAIIATDPSSAGKVKLMDPGGSDVPDPIGGPIEDYRQTARSLRTMIQKRLDEIAAQDRA